MSSPVPGRVPQPASCCARGDFASGGQETGPLAGRVAELRESSGKPAIVFIRRDNEVDGRPTIDSSDTWCYFEP